MANLDLLRKSLLGSLDTDRDSRSLLEQMARTIGENLGVSACLLVAGEPAAMPTAIGFWHENHLSLPLIAQESPLASDQSVLGTGRGICLARLPGVELGWWERVAPLQYSWAIGIAFRGVRNGLLVIGAGDPDRITGDEPRTIEEIASTLGIIYHALPLAPESLTPLDQDKIDALPLPILRASPGQGSPLVLQLYQLMRQQLEQQRLLNERLDDIITAMSDRARNPLATMKMAIGALSDPARNLSDTSRAQFWGILKHEWNTINQLINNIIVLKQLQSRELAVCSQPLDFTALLQETAGRFQQRWKEDVRRSLQIEMKSPPSGESVFMTTDPQQIQKIFDELLSNAEKFAHPQTTVQIEIAEVGNDEIAIAVSDRGLRIALEERELIFEPFRRGRGITDRAIPGTGIGLAIVKGLLDLLHGRIEVTSEPTGEAEQHLTVFTVILPRSFPGNRPLASLIYPPD